MTEAKYQNKESLLKFVKRRYVITIILPIFFVFQWMIVAVLRIENQYQFIAKILVYIGEGILGLFIVFFIITLFKRKYKESFRILVTPIIVITIAFVLLNKYGIDRDMIYYHLNKSKYLSVIENSPSIATDGKGRLVQIPMKGTYIGCDKYLIYDETDEIANPKGSFRGINYVTAHDINNRTYAKKPFETRVAKLDNHIYVVYFCQDTGQ